MSRDEGVVARCRRAGPLGGRAVAVAALLGGASSASGVGLAATSAWLITRASLRPPVLALAVAIGSVQALALGRAVARYGERLAVHDLSLGVLARLRVLLFDRLEPLVPGGLPGRRSGSLLAAFVTDADAVAGALAREVVATIETGVSVAAGVTLGLLVDPAAGLVLAGGSAVATGTALAGARWQRARAESEAAGRDELYDAVVAAARAAADLVALGREDVAVERVAAAGARAEHEARRSATATGLRHAGVVAVAGATLVGVLAVGLAAVRDGRLGPVALAVLALASLAALEPLGALPAVLAASTDGRVSAKRLAALDRCAPAAPEPDDPAAPPDRPAGLALESAVVTRGATPVLAGLSLDVPPGRRVGLAGASGAGKTTAVLALLHFVECTAGRAALGGLDVARLSRDTLGARIGWVPDEAHVFQGSVGANLRLARPGASDEACRGALERVGLGPWLAGLPEGLATLVGSTGRATSAGERQRLCLARALLTDPDVLVLDEPTAHLDPAGAAEVVAELVAAAGERSVLLVSHDEQDLALLDEVVVLGEAGPGPRGRRQG